MTTRRVLIALLIIGLALRLLYGLSLDPSAPYADAGGDSGWYLLNGYALVYGDLPDGSTDVSRLAPPPVYLVILGVAQGLFAPETAVIVVRGLQALLSTALIYFLYRLARLISRSQRAALIAGAITALSPALIIESGGIFSETVYLCFTAAGLWLYGETLRVGNQRAWLIGAGVLLGLATLTRAPLLLFPVGLAIHLVLVYGWRDGLRRSVLLLASYALIVSTWTVYNLERWDRFVIAGEGFAAFLFIGADGWDSPEAVDERLGVVDDADRQTQFLDAAATSITADPFAYARRRLSELGESVLQPHNTVVLGGASLRTLIVEWISADRSLTGLISIAQSDAFAPKLALYVVHFATIILGVIGMVRMRSRWRFSLPLIGLIAYVLLLHLLLLALPRYIFPTVIAWYPLAGCAFAKVNSIHVEASEGKRRSLSSV